MVVEGLLRQHYTGQGLTGWRQTAFAEHRQYAFEAHNLKIDRLVRMNDRRIGIKLTCLGSVHFRQLKNPSNDEPL